MTSYLNSSNQLVLLKSAALYWTTGPIIITIASSIGKDDIKSINSSETIGKKAQVPSVGKRDNGNYYWLHSSINENNEQFRHERIHPMFVLLSM